jgi:hypothetical protein
LRVGAATADATGAADALDEEDCDDDDDELDIAALGPAKLRVPVPNGEKKEQQQDPRGEGAPQSIEDHEWTSLREGLYCVWPVTAFSAKPRFRVAPRLGDSS